MPVLNQSLAEKLHSIQVFANGYQLAEIQKSDFCIDYSQAMAELPYGFTAKELADPWVRIRPSTGESTFCLMFTSTTPRRMYSFEEMRDSPENKTGC
jgi:hypothetical protein